MRNPYKIGLIEDAVTVAQDFISLFGGGDAVPNYPVKKIETFNSLLASINQEIPLPPATVADAQRLLDKATAMYIDHQDAAKWGTGDANTTVLMLLNERIIALKNYIASNGGTFQLPSPGTATATQTYYPATTAPKQSLFSSPLFWGAAIVGIYFITKKKR